MAEDSDALSSAVAEGGAYELIRGRLLEQIGGLESAVSGLNEKREETFGRTAMDVLSRVRVRTENNCIPRDIVRVGDQLLFGYNVFIGLKRETTVDDVFAAYHLENGDGGISIAPAQTCEFLTNQSFVSDFRDLYAYYKAAQLIRMQVVGQRLFAIFQVGENIDDIRVFRWQIETDGSAQYIDDRGEREIPRPPHHDFTWHACGREDLRSTGSSPAYSLAEKIFVEIDEGQLRFLAEDNTASGALLMSEGLEESNQTLDDCRIGYAEVSGLLLVSVLPYGEEATRYFTYDALRGALERHDEIGIAARALPEDQGVIFPGGYCLVNGTSRRFEDDVSGLRFSRQIVSPNGEDVLYVFYEPNAGNYGLYAYNLIRKSLENPIYAHGYSLFDDGTLVIFRSVSDEPSRNHPMQVWRTSFFSDEHASQAEDDGPLARIGNNELVRGISDLLGIVQAARSEQVTVAAYNALIQTCARIKDNYFWLDQAELGQLDKHVDEVAATAELVLDEFEKVAEIQAHANRSLREAETDQQTLLREIDTSEWHHAQDFVRALGQLRKQRGHLLTIAELRYIDKARIAELESQCTDAHDRLAENTVSFLLRDDALVPYRNTFDELEGKLEKANTAADVRPIMEGYDTLGEELDLLTEILGSLAVEDATQRTVILESISELFAKLNAAKAKARNQTAAFGSDEARAEFAAQFTLFSQSVTNALAAADTPERCDAELSRLNVALQELEGRFGEYDEFLPDIVSKREELQDAFDAHRQSLLDQRQRRAQNLYDAAERILEGVPKRANKCADVDELNTYFSTDALLLKLKDTIASLRELDDAVKADDLEGRIKAAQDNALRSLRDRRDIFENDGTLIKLGNHRFSVNQQALELTIIPRENGLYAHMTGTGFAEQIDHPELERYREQWQQTLASETAQVYRSEYLAAEILAEADEGQTLNTDTLQEALLDEGSAIELVRKRATARYTEGYEKGVHDHDAQLILQQVVPRMDEMGLLTYVAAERALAAIFWNCRESSEEAAMWQAQAVSAAQLSRLFPGQAPYRDLMDELATAIEAFQEEVGLLSEASAARAARFLATELADSPVAFTMSQAAADLLQTLKDQLKANRLSQSFNNSLARLADSPGQKFRLLLEWLTAAANARGITHPLPVATEAAAIAFLNSEKKVKLKTASTELSIAGLLGQHPNVSDGNLQIAVDEFLQRTQAHRSHVVPAYAAYQDVRHSVAETLRGELRLDDLQARPLSSFVRNKLLNDVYLPIIGANLAKQLGAADDAKRTDLMGLLLFISPPGYGKTTLMEYVADRLGLIFVKVNGPALGHSVVSLDPEQAPSATSRQELEKLNLAFEMGNNVMLYVDDIQHTNPEFLQKFISLCDGTRRIEGVWRGEPRTYDLRGRRFCVIMAGNPYTESGDVFQIPDMLANRADVYNLGDVLSGREDVFALSYIENSLTSNPVLAPLATRDMEDVYRFVRRAQGEAVADTDFSHAYSAAEANEIVAVLKKMIDVQRVVLSVNQEYIRSAATDEAFRTEPPFKLQGSYRNMNKLAEKVLPIMNDEELQALLDDHYAGESQLLTGEAEFNVLKLAELRGTLTDEARARLDQILGDYRRTKSLGGDEADPATRLSLQLASINESIGKAASEFAGDSAMEREIKALTSTIRDAEIKIINQPSQVVEEAMVNLAKTIETTFMPVVAAMDKKIDLDLAILRRVSELNDGIDAYRDAVKGDPDDA